ncbi:hypothetical protein SAMN05216249_10223 [Acetitomaculum ruminis DSM 5522]|uniref:Uncharacterized protein n=1 Tax=Acetitomaculum ruminis DSM 5522 TaxID=1120918 RepID=A0A1I0VIF9_9FIRM|nr:hypothetical protein [Acetitomaculum ruminis]SFA75988.1 hypothetical protein SAMN05216249_10223 [Acetitomaculum ruminis DSM 5522]
MKFSKKLYYGKEASRHKRKILWRLKHNKILLDTYVICFASNKNNLFDIINANILLQKYYPKDDLTVLAIGESYDETLELLVFLIDNVYKKTGAFNVREFYS